MSLFLAADACLSWSLPSITEQQVSPHYAVLAEESLTRPGFLQTLPAHQLSNSAILHNNYISLLSDLCACVHVKKKWHRNGSHSSSVSGSNHLVWYQTRNSQNGRNAFLSSFFFFRRASSNLHDSSQWFSHKTAAFSLSSAPAHRFFPGLKSHETIRTAHWRTMASFTTPFYLHVYACAQITLNFELLATKCNYYARLPN